jgi:hypothetical protein
MKRPTLPLRNLMNRSPRHCGTVAAVLIPLVLGCFALAPTARAVDPSGYNVMGPKNSMCLLVPTMIRQKFVKHHELFFVDCCAPKRNLEMACSFAGGRNHLNLTCDSAFRAEMKSSISCVSTIPPINDPARLRRRRTKGIASIEHQIERLRTNVLNRLQDGLAG